MFSNLAKERIFFTQHLYLMLKGGFLISDALEILKKEIKSQKFKLAIDDILSRILGGQSLSDSLSKHPKIFDKFYQNIIRIGEESGSLESNLKYLASQLNSDYETKKKVKGAMFYPLMVITLALIIAFSVTIFILPKLLGVFAQLQMKLPLSTKILISSVSFVESNWIFIIIGIIIFIVLLKILRRFMFFKYLFDKLAISLPITGTITKNIILARFAQNFHTLLKSGIPILKALEILSETLSNEAFKRNLDSIKLEVERGGRISKGFAKFPKTFPLIFSQMVSVGENSGALEDSYSYLNKFYQKEVNSSLKTLSSTLEPVLLIFVGIFVVFIALAIIVPIYQFSGDLKLR